MKHTCCCWCCGCSNRRCCLNPPLLFDWSSLTPNCRCYSPPIQLHWTKHTWLMAAQVKVDRLINEPNFRNISIRANSERFFWDSFGRLKAIWRDSPIIWYSVRFPPRFFLLRFLGDFSRLCGDSRGLFTDSSRLFPSLLSHHQSNPFETITQLLAHKNVLQTAHKRYLWPTSRTWYLH